MRYELAIVIILLLLTVSYSQSTLAGQIQWVKQDPKPFSTGEFRSSSIVYLSKLSQTLGNLPAINYQSVCWARICTTQNISNRFIANESDCSRWILTGINTPWITEDSTTVRETPLGYLTNPLAISFQNPFSSETTHSFSFGFQDASSRDDFTYLCPGYTNETDYLVVWYGGPADTQIWNSTVNSFWGTIDRWSSSDASSLLTLDKQNISYKCFHASNVEEISMTFTNFAYQPTLNTSTDVNKSKVAFQYQCAPFSAQLNMWFATWQVDKLVQAPNTLISDNTTFTKDLIHASKDIQQQNDLGNIISRAIYVAVADLVSEASKTLRKDLPEPIPSIVRTMNEIVNAVIAIGVLWILYKIISQYLAFKRALKTSLTKASLIIVQLFFWFTIVLLVFWGLVHMPTYCGIKAMASLTALKVVGVELEAPQSFPYIGETIWNGGVFAVVAVSSSDCASYWNAEQTTDYLQLNNSDISLIIRSIVVIIMIVLIFVSLGILWDTASYLRRKVKKMEEDVRKPDVDDTIYEDEEF